MKNEVDILDIKGDRTGDKITALSAHEQGVWHAVAHIWFYTDDGKIMVQLRAQGKESYPGLWDISAAGHVDAGENIVTAARREISEEIGLEIEEKNLEKIFVRKNACIIPGKNWRNNEYQHVYLCNWAGNISELSLQTEEVENIKFIGLKDFEKRVLRVKNNGFVPHGIDYYEKLISEIKKRIKK